MQIQPLSEKASRKMGRRTPSDARHQNVRLPISAETLPQEGRKVSSWRFSNPQVGPRSGSAPGLSADIPHLLREQALCTTLVVVARGYNANYAGVVLA
jgi:hypothetical protein